VYRTKSLNLVLTFLLLVDDPILTTLLLKASKVCLGTYMAFYKTKCSIPSVQGGEVKDPL